MTLATFYSHKWLCHWVYSKINNFFLDVDVVNWENIRSKLHKVNWRTEFVTLEPGGILEKITNTCLSVTKYYIPAKEYCDTKGRKGQCIRSDSKFFIQKRSHKIKQLVKTAIPSKKKEIQSKLIQIEKELKFKSHQKMTKMRKKKL